MKKGLIGILKMARRKDSKRSKVSETIAKAIIDEYHPKNAKDMQSALKEIFGPMFEAMLQGGNGFPSGI